MANALLPRLLSPAEASRVRGRVSGVTVIDLRLVAALEERYDRAALRDSVLGSWKPEAFDYRRPTATESDRSDPVRP